MAGSEARATRCKICQKKACRGECKKCPLRVQGECKNYFIPVAENVGKQILWDWVCADCYFK